MKRAFRMLSVIIAVALTTQIYTPAAVATYNDIEQDSDVLYYETCEENHSTEAVAQANDDLFYAYSDEEISYCAQIIPDGRIQFSYYIADNDLLMESDVYLMSDIYSDYSIEQKDDQNYLALNRAIMNNIGAFSNVHEVEGATTIAEDTGNATRAATSGDGLDDALEAKYSTNYSGLFKGMSKKTYDGTTYTVTCTESQTTSYTTPDSYWFAKETAISAITAWLTSGSWLWKGTILTIVLDVVSTVVKDGVKKQFTILQLKELMFP